MRRRTRCRPRAARAVVCLLSLLFDLGLAVRVGHTGVLGDPSRSFVAVASPLFADGTAQRFPFLRAASRLVARPRSSCAHNAAGPRPVHSSGLPSDDDEAGAPRPEAELVRLGVNGGSGEYLSEVGVPPEWARRIASDSGVEVLSWQPLPSGGGGDWTSTMCEARLRGKAASVRFEVAPTRSPEVQRFRYVFRRLRMLEEAGLVPTSHNVCAAYETHAFERSTCTLLPQADQNVRTLVDRMWSEHVEGEEVSWSVYRESLHILADILRGARSLERAGVVSFDLLPESIFVDGGRAYIGDFGNMCAQHVQDGILSCRCIGDTQDQTVDAALRHAPEIALGHSPGHASSIWAVGIIFAELVLGVMPVSAYIVRGFAMMGPFPNMDSGVRAVVEMLYKFDESPTMRRVIRTVVASDFTIDAFREFHDLPPCLKFILLGMLDKDAGRRWNATEALQKVEQLLYDLGEVVRAEAPRLRLPSAWLDFEP